MVANSLILNQRSVPEVTNTVVLNQRSSPEVSRNSQETSGGLRRLQTVFFKPKKFSEDFAQLAGDIRSSPEVTNMVVLN